MGRLVFSETGIQVHLPDPAKDVDFERYGGDPSLGTRTPLLYDEKKRQAYVGAPGWYHGDVRGHHNLELYGNDHDEGYFGGDENWGNGNLEWYFDPPASHPHLVEALNEAGMKVPDTPGTSRYRPDQAEPMDAWEEDDLPELDNAWNEE